MSPGKLKCDTMSSSQREYELCVRAYAWGDYKKKGTSKKRGTDSLPQAHSCGSALSDTSGERRETSGGGSLSVDSGGQTELGTISSLS